MFSQISALNMAPPRAQPTADGSGGIVSGTSNALAVYSGVFALEQGGTAMDACVATSIAQAVLSAGAYTSLAGIAHILYYDAATNTTTHYNGGWNTVRGNLPDAIPVSGLGASMMVPGYWAVLDAAVKDNAAFSLATLIQPALYFAETGFSVYPELASLIHSYNSTLFRTPEGRAIFTSPATGKPYTVGDNFTQADVARFLAAIQTDGISTVYNGSWAHSLVDVLSSWGSNITLDDMTSYAAQVHPALVGSYGAQQQHEVYSTAPPEKGGVSVSEALILMHAAGFDAGSMRPYPVDGTSMFWLIQIARWTALSSDIASCPGGISALEATFPPFKFDDGSRLDPARASSVWQFMQSQGGVKAIQAGFQDIFEGKHEAHRTEGPAPPSAIPRWHVRGPYHSDGIVAMDSKGNVCSMVHTINSSPWGTGLFAQGIALSDAAMTQLAPIKATAPGARLTGPIAPVIVRSGDANRVSSALWTAVSTVGASLHEVTLQMLTLHLDNDQAVNMSILIPKFLLPTAVNGSGTYPAAQLIPNEGFPPDVITQVVALGQPMDVVNFTQALNNMGFPVMLTAEGGGCCNAATPAVPHPEDSSDTGTCEQQGYATELLNGYAGSATALSGLTI